MSKVYCGKCRHIKKYEWGIHQPDCKKTAVEVSTPTAVYTRYEECRTINRNNNCLHFEHKWFVRWLMKIHNLFNVTE